MAKSAKLQMSLLDVSFDALLAALGKPVDDAAAKALLEGAGKVKVSSDFVVAKEAGFDIALDRRDGVKKKVLSTAFLFAPGADGHAGFAGLPAPFSFSDRATLRAAKMPDEAFTLDDGDVPLTHPESERDTWIFAGYELSAEYKGDGSVGYFTASVREAEPIVKLDTNPLHFEAAPVDAPDDAALVGMALLLGWASARFGVAAKHADSEPGQQLASRACEPLAFLREACRGKLTSKDVDARLEAFLYGYTSRMFLGTRAPGREPTAAAIGKLLRLERKDERAYADDFLGTFADAVTSPFYVPGTWAAVARIAPVLDARWADFEATKFKAAPDMALYEHAAKARDAVRVSEAKKAVAAAKADAALARSLLAMLGQPVKAVKQTLEANGLPIGKRVDEQANPNLGVSYLGSNRKVAGKNVLSVMSLGFYAAGQSSFIRGLGQKVTFAGYPAEIALGVRLGMSRADVANAFGAPSRASDEKDTWYPDAGHRISASFDSTGLVELHFGIIDDGHAPATPPFGPAGVF